MANYSPNEATIFAREFVKGIPVSQVDFQVADQIQTALWNFYPWQFTFKQKTKVGDAFLTDQLQDITGVPTDFYRLVWARLTRTDLTDGNHYKELEVVQRLDPQTPTLKFDYTSHEFLAYVPEVAKFRLEYPLYIYTGTELTQLDIEYQKAPTKITAANMATPFVDQPDWFWPTFSDGVLWRFMVLANDRRQGGLQVSKGGQRTYTGQMGVFYNSLIERAATERQMAGALRFPAMGSLGAVR